MEDVDLPGEFQARFLYSEKRWIVCLRPAEPPSTTTSESSLLINHFEGDDLPLPRPKDVELKDTAGLEASSMAASVAFYPEEKDAREAKLFGGLNELQKAVRDILEWFTAQETLEDMGEEFASAPKQVMTLALLFFLPFSSSVHLHRHRGKRTSLLLFEVDFAMLWQPCLCMASRDAWFRLQKPRRARASVSGI